MRIFRLASIASSSGVTLLLLAGCSSEVRDNCIDECNAHKACPGSNQNENCEANCTLLADDAAEKGCEAETDALIDCSRKDGCVELPTCGAESDAWSKCLTDFCTANPHDPGCAQP